VLGVIALSLSMAVVPQDVPRPRAAACDRGALTPQMREQALAEFNHQIEQYVLLHRRLEQQLPPPRPFDDADEMLKARAALAHGIRAARPDARPGDIFTICPARLFKDIVQHTLVTYGRDPQHVIKALNENREPGAKLPAVNRKYDWRLGAWVWPALLRELPQLPDALEYRMVDADLLVIDLRANIVVDILENAMPVEEE
jgi:hypothetical protein